MKEKEFKPIIILNHNPKEIDVKTDYDKANVCRINIKLKGDKNGN